MSRSAPTATATTEDISPAEGRGAAGPVVLVHVQTRRVLVMTAAFVVAAVVAGAVGIGDGWWIPLHLFVVGLTSYALGLIAIGALLLAYAHKKVSWAGPRVVQLVAGLAWWVAMTVALAVARLRETDDRSVLQALVRGRPSLPATRQRWPRSSVRVGPSSWPSRCGSPTSRSAPHACS